MADFKKIITLCFIISFLFSSGQNRQIDSLRSVSQNQDTQSSKAEIFNQIADLFKTTYPDSLKFYAEKALEISQKLKQNGEIRGTAYINLGNYYILTSNYPQALKQFDEAKTIFENLPESKYQVDLARVYGSIGIVFSEQSNYEKALEFHLKAVKIYENQNDLAKMSRVYNNIGVVYKAREEFSKSLEYYLKSLKVQKKVNDTSIGITLTNIGNIYSKQNNQNKAINYYKEAEKSFRDFPNFRGEGELFNNLGLFYEKEGQFQLALEYWNKAIAAFKQIDNSFGVSDTYYHLGNFYFNRGNFENALINTEKANALANKLNVLEMILLTEKLISEIYEVQNKSHMALKHYKLYQQVKDSLVNYEKIRNGVQLEMNYDFEKKEIIHQQQKLSQEKLLQEQSKKHFLQLTIIGLLLTLILGGGGLIYNRNQLKKNLTLQKNLAEYEQKALHLQMNPHFVFNCLSSISSFIVQNSNESAIKYLAKFSKLMRLTLEYSKESLIPLDKEIESLRNYLELEQLRFNNAFEFTIQKDIEIEDDFAIPPLLIQPFVENAIIHGLVPKKEFGTIFIRFEAKKMNLFCIIEDNGVGIEKSKLRKEKSVSAHQSMALDIIKKRLEMIEHKTNKRSYLQIEELKDANGKPRGTKVIVTLPIQYVDNKTISFQ